MKQEFEKAEIEIILFNEENIIATSTGPIGGDDVVTGGDDAINWG